MIEVEAVSKTFPSPGGGEFLAVSGVSFVVEKGETLCLIGTSGSGKTTTMKMVNRLIEPTGGTIRVDGQDVVETDPIRLRRQIGYVIQKGGLFPHMTVARNVALLCHLEGWQEQAIRARVDTLLQLVNLPADTYASRYPSELSGGQRQRVGVARALALDPDYILMDEPFGALDPITREQIHEEFVQLKQQVQKTIILVTHDMAEAFKLGDRVALMNEGHLVQWGTEADFRERPASEFVEEFLRSHLASPGTDILIADAMDESVPLIRLGGEGTVDPAVLVGPNGSPAGVLFEGEVREVAPLEGDCCLKAGLERLMESDLPLAPVAQDGRAVGAVTRDSLLGRL